ncbi:MAG: hypothetical protein ACYC6Q_07805 [Syntrophales bacterium]
MNNPLVIEAYLGKGGEQQP